MMKLKIVFVVLSSIILLLVSCNNLVEKQSKYLLPDNNSLRLTLEQEFGITEYRVYEVVGKLDHEELSMYPINQYLKKELIKWHIPSDNEIRNMELFFQEEQSSHEITYELIYGLSEGEYLIALIHDEDDYPLCSDKYSVYNWMDLYFLSEKENKLIHLSYGKF